MADPETTRWTVNVSKQTDQRLRAFLGGRGMRKGDISKFIEEAVRWRMLNATRAQVQEAFADLSPAEVDELVKEAVLAAGARGGASKASVPGPAATGS